MPLRWLMEEPDARAGEPPPGGTRLAISEGVQGHEGSPPPEALVAPPRVFLPPSSPPQITHGGGLAGGMVGHTGSRSTEGLHSHNSLLSEDFGVQSSQSSEDLYLSLVRDISAASGTELREAWIDTVVLLFADVYASIPVNPERLSLQKSRYPTVKTSSPTMQGNTLCGSPSAEAYSLF